MNRMSLYCIFNACMIPVILAIMIIMTFLISIIIDEFQIVEVSDLRSIHTSQTLFSGSLPSLFCFLFYCIKIKKRFNKRKEKH